MHVNKLDVTYDNNKARVFTIYVDLFISTEGF